MTKPTDPVQGKVLAGGKKLADVSRAATSLEALSALTDMVAAAREYGVLREEHRTRRADTATYAALESQRIQAAESVIKDYFRQSFAERSKMVDGLLERFDAATAAGDTASATSALGALVEVAKTSPLADLKDFSHIRAALNDPDKEWEL